MSSRARREVRAAKDLGMEGGSIALFSRAVVTGEVIGYAPSPGAGYSKADAQIIGVELERIAGEGAGVATETVVASARPADAPLHPFFTWEDKKAADQFRLSEARNLINHLDVVVRTTSGDAVRTKAFYSCVIPVTHVVTEAEDAVDEESGADVAADAPSARRCYIPVFTAATREDTKDQLYRQAVRDLQGWQLRYAAIGDDRLQPVFDALGSLLPA